MDLEIDGVDETIDSFEKMEEKAQELDGDHEVPLNVLFNDEFMQRYTQFDSLGEFFGRSPWSVESGEDIDAIPQDEMDDYINKHTGFDDTDEMTGEAAAELAARNLGFSPE